MSGSDDGPLILICNDDGIEAHGIQALAAALDGLGKLVVVAPEREQSAVGHAITVRDPVRALSWEFEVPSGPIKAWAVTGTPADCVKLACNQLLPRKPDILVSGINQGPNTAVNVIYSGTVSAATEAAILGIDGVAFSLCNWDPNADFEPAGIYARRITEKVLLEGLQPDTLLNVNIPPLPLASIRGIQITRQANGRWKEEFSARMDPFNRPYYWLTGSFVNLDEGEDNDLSAIENAMVSVTPLHLDLTAYQQIERLKSWDWDSGAGPAASRGAARKRSDGKSEQEARERR